MDHVIPPDWLGQEGIRNRQNADVYTALIQAAYGPEYHCLVGHHLCFQQGGDITTENEIPAADALIFDHAIMRRVFFGSAIDVMIGCAMREANERDAYLREMFEVFQRDCIR